MRGSLHDDMLHYAVVGIIPAHAGLTKVSLSQLALK